MTASKRIELESRGSVWYYRKGPADSWRKLDRIVPGTTFSPWQAAVRAVQAKGYTITQLGGYPYREEPMANKRRGARRRTASRNPRGTTRRRQTFTPPYHVESWEERDRLHIHLVDANNRTVAEWWDEDAAQMFEDGFFVSRRLQSSVIEYARSVGLIK